AVQIVLPLFFQAEDGIRDFHVTGVKTCALPILIATDHAPHTIEEKSESYWKAPSGLPLTQHALQVMLEMVKQGKITLEKVVEKKIGRASCRERGLVREVTAKEKETK